MPEPKALTGVLKYLKNNRLMALGTSYRTRFKWADEFKSNHILYVIKPREVWYLDEKLFGHFYRVRIK